MNEMQRIVEAYEKLGLRRIAAAIIVCAKEDLTKYTLQGLVNARTLKVQERIGGLLNKRTKVTDVTSAVALFIEEGRLEALLAFRTDCHEYAGAVRRKVREHLLNLAPLADRQWDVMLKAPRAEVERKTDSESELSRAGSQETRR